MHLSRYAIDEERKSSIPYWKSSPYNHLGIAVIDAIKSHVRFMPNFEELCLDKEAITKKLEASLRSVLGLECPKDLDDDDENIAPDRWAFNWSGPFNLSVVIFGTNVVTEVERDDDLVFEGEKKLEYEQSLRHIGSLLGDIESLVSKALQDFNEHYQIFTTKPQLTPADMELPHGINSLADVTKFDWSKVDSDRLRLLKAVEARQLANCLRERRVKDEKFCSLNSSYEWQKFSDGKWVQRYVLFEMCYNRWDDFEVEDFLGLDIKVLNERAFETLQKRIAQAQ